MGGVRIVSGSSPRGVWPALWRDSSVIVIAELPVFVLSGTMRPARTQPRTIKNRKMQRVEIADRFAAKISGALKKPKPSNDRWTLRHDARQLIERIKD